MTVEKIEINKNYLSVQTAFALAMEKDMSEAEKKDFEKARIANAQLAYEEIKRDFLQDHDLNRFIVNVSGNTDLCIQACFRDKELKTMLSPGELRFLVIQCFIHEGHGLPRIRQRMKSIVRKNPEKFSDEIILDTVIQVFSDMSITQPESVLAA